MRIAQAIINAWSEFIRWILLEYLHAVAFAQLIVIRNEPIVVTTVRCYCTIVTLLHGRKYSDRAATPSIFKWSNVSADTNREWFCWEMWWPDWRRSFRHGNTSLTGDFLVIKAFILMGLLVCKKQVAKLTWFETAWPRRGWRLSNVWLIWRIELRCDHGIS